MLNYQSIQTKSELLIRMFQYLSRMVILTLWCGKTNAKNFYPGCMSVCRTFSTSEGLPDIWKTVVCRNFHPTCLLHVITSVRSIEDVEISLKETIWIFIKSKSTTATLCSLFLRTLPRFDLNWWNTCRLRKQSLPSKVLACLMALWLFHWPNFPFFNFSVEMY